MNSVTPNHFSDVSSSHFHRSSSKNVIASASSVLDETPPPSLREILSAYKAKGDGDRDMLLAMLNAKTAEDQRLASLASLHRTMLELSQSTSQMSTHYNGNHQYPTPSLTHSQKSREQWSPPRRTYHPSGSPPPLHMRSTPFTGSEPPRKRHRSSHSPPPARLTAPSDPHTGSQSDHLPPSPYSSSGSDSAGYSPRSRTSMAIGSLLSSSTAPNRETSSGDPSNSNSKWSSRAESET